jgi:glycogen debranching enzyme
MSLLEQAEREAIKVLKRCAHARGFKAAAHYYPQVWARDGVITALGALTTDADELIRAARATLDTLAEYQCPETGRIPNYIPVDQPTVTLPVNEAFDSNLWYVIGHDALYARTRDREFVESRLESLRQAVRWARHMDSNNDGLIECHACADWKDTWDNGYHNLNVNVLYAEALAALARMEEAAGGTPDAYTARRTALLDLINANFWVGHGDEQRERRYAACRPGHLANSYDINRAVQWANDFYFPHLPMKERAPRRLDTMGNLAAILYGVADDGQCDRILNFIDEHGVAEPYPIRVTHPVVRSGDPDHHPYYDNRGYCMEHTGHNGGIWAFVGGFYVAALVKAGRCEQARVQLAKLAELNHLPAGGNDNPDRTAEWGFCEHHHGQTGRGIGAQWQAWSAGMYLYALNAVRTASS